jgi:hypothetical protein
MSFWDDIGAKIKEGADNVVKDVQTNVNQYFQQRLIDPLVKIGEPAKGNLTAAEIAAGERGAPPPIAAAASAPVIQQNLMMYLPIVAIAVGALILIKKVK